MLVEKEVILRGGPENDYPVGEFVWCCSCCNADFHGDQYDYICYNCAMEEDIMNNPSRDYMWPVLIPLMGLALASAIFWFVIGFFS